MRAHLGSFSFLREEKSLQKNGTLCRRDEMHLRVTVYVVRAVTAHVRHVRRTRPSGSKWFFTRDTIKLVSSFFPVDVKRVALESLALNTATRRVSFMIITVTEIRRCASESERETSTQSCQSSHRELYAEWTLCITMTRYVFITRVPKSILIPQLPSKSRRCVRNSHTSDYIRLL